MNKSLVYTVMFLLIAVIVFLSVFLIQSQKTINAQRITISTQQKQITELQAEVNKLSAATPENLLRMSGQFAKEKGANILRSLLFSE